MPCHVNAHSLIHNDDVFVWDYGNNFSRIVTYLFEKTQDGIVQRFHATEDIEIGEVGTQFSCFWFYCADFVPRVNSRSLESYRLFVLSISDGFAPGNNTLLH